MVNQAVQRCVLYALVLFATGSVMLSTVGKVVAQPADGLIGRWYSDNMSIGRNEQSYIQTRVCGSTEYSINGKITVHGEVKVELFKPIDRIKIVSIRISFRGSGKWALSNNELAETLIDVKSAAKLYQLLDDNGPIKARSLPWEVKEWLRVIAKLYESEVDKLLLKGTTASSRVVFLGGGRMIQEIKGDDGLTSLHLSEKTNKSHSVCRAGR